MLVTKGAAIGSSIQLPHERLRLLQLSSHDSNPLRSFVLGLGAPADAHLLLDLLVLRPRKLPGIRASAERLSFQEASSQLTDW